MVCGVDGCDRNSRTITEPMCNMHRIRAQRHGDAGEAEPRHVLTGWVAPPARDGYKWCQLCHQELPVANYSVRRASGDGLQARCKQCCLDAKRLSSYGLTPADYQTMVEAQNGVCAICHLPDRLSLSVDHDHSCCPGNKTCGKCIRGLLCARCNHVLGLVYDDAALMKEFSNYLNGWVLQQETRCQK